MLVTNHPTSTHYKIMIVDSLQYNDYSDSLQHPDAVMLEFHGCSIVL